MRFGWKNTTKKALLFACLFASLTAEALAHAPVVNDSGLEYSEEAPFEIEDPEHSKAIFSELLGSAQYFRIVSDRSFRFYVGITQAKLNSCDMQRSFSFEVLDINRQRIDGRDGTDFEWWPWYEEFGKTWYWVGPEIGKDFKGDQVYEAGTYWIKVFNSDNRGKYVLSVGDIERFGVGTILGMVLNRTMKKIRTGWWDESQCEQQ